MTSPVSNFNKTFEMVPGLHGKVHERLYINCGLFWVRMAENGVCQTTFGGSLSHEISFCGN